MSVRISCLRSRIFLLIVFSLFTPPIFADQPAVVFLGTDPVTLNPTPSAAAVISSFGVDAAGNQFYVDTSLGQIIELGSGIKTVIAKGFDKPLIDVDYHGNVFVADRGTNRILEVSSNYKHPVSVLATGATSLQAIAVDSADNVFFVSGNGIVEIPSGGTPTPVASVTGAAALAFGQAVNGVRQLYILSRQGSSASAYLYSYTSGSGTLTGPIAGFLPAITGGTISGFVVDPRGNAVVVNEGNGNAQIILGTSAGFESTIYTSQLTATPIAEDSNGAIYFLDNGVFQQIQLGAVNFGSAPLPSVVPGGGRIIKLHFGVPPDLTWSPEIDPEDSSGQYGNFQFQCDYYYPCDSAGTVAVFATPNDAGPVTGILTLVDQNNNKLINIPLYEYGVEPFEAFYDPAPNLSRQTGSSEPVDIVSLPICSVTPPCSATYVMDAGTGQIWPWFFGNYGSPTVSGLKNPQKFTVDGDGNFYITQGGVAGVLVVALDGSKKQIATDLANPIGLTLDGAGNLYVTNGDDIVKIAPDGSESLFLTAEVDGGFKSALSVTTDFQGNLYAGFASSPYYDRGAILKIAPNGSFQALHVNVLKPVALSAARDSVLFFTDAGKGTLYLYSSNQIQKSLAFGLKNPVGIAADSTGDVFVADSGLGNVLGVGPGPSPRNFGNVPVGSSRTLTLTAVYVGTDPDPVLAGFELQPGPFCDAFSTSQSAYPSTVGELLNVPFTFKPQSTGPDTSCIMGLIDNYDLDANLFPTPFVVYGNGVAPSN